jgi:hypothetical protein
MEMHPNGTAWHGVARAEDRRAAQLQTIGR